MRTSSAAALLILAGCSSDAADVPPPNPADVIECALGNAVAFARDCVVERSPQEGGLLLVVHHPDGGFRRFEVLTDGGGLAPADGADPARIALHGEGIEVAVGTDRYRFPATIAGDERP